MSAGWWAIVALASLVAGVFTYVSVYVYAVTRRARAKLDETGGAVVLDVETAVNDAEELANKFEGAASALRCSVPGQRPPWPDRAQALENAARMLRRDAAACRQASSNLQHSLGRAHSIAEANGWTFRPRRRVTLPDVEPGG